MIHTADKWHAMLMAIFGVKSLGQFRMTQETCKRVRESLFVLTCMESYGSYQMFYLFVRMCELSMYIQYYYRDVEYHW